MANRKQLQHAYNSIQVGMHLQIETHCTDYIEQGVGLRIPSDDALCEHFNVETQWLHFGGRMYKLHDVYKTINCYDCLIVCVTIITRRQRNCPDECNGTHGSYVLRHVAQWKTNSIPAVDGDKGQRQHRHRHANRLWV